MEVDSYCEYPEPLLKDCSCGCGGRCRDIAHFRYQEQSLCANHAERVALDTKDFDNITPLTRIGEH